MTPAMGIRDTIERRRGIALLVAALAIVLVGLQVARSTMSRPTGPAAEAFASRAFFTTDEGKTSFVDRSDEKLAPFDHEGKTAYRVYLFTCDGGRSRFAGYLERYTPEAQRRLAAARRGDAAAAGLPPGRPIESLVRELADSGTEVKKPGADQRWVRRNDAQAAANVLDVRCPDGSPAERVLP